MQKHIHGGTKEWLLIILSVVLFLTVLILPLKWAVAVKLTDEEQILLHAWETDQIIRLHIIANSDSADDQTIKLKVRDALIEAFGELLIEKGDTSCEEMYRVLEQNADKMQQTALTCAQSYGFSGEVAAEVGVLHLPEKQYGNVYLPEGKYRALRITLGKGAGRNWWCVLFPNLCLSLSKTEESAAQSHSWSSERIFSNWLLINCR